MQIDLKDIASVLIDIEHEFFNVNSTSIWLSNASLSSSSNEETLTWINDRFDNLETIFNANWGLVICSKSSFNDLVKLGKPNFLVLVVAEPKHIFSKLAEKFLARQEAHAIHASAVVHPEAQIGSNVAIGSFCTIGKCIIGDNTVIHSSCVIHNHVIVGSNVVINSGSVVGGSPFIFTKNKSGLFERFPTFGGVILEDFVELGANTCIDRGSSGNTVLKMGVKVDNLVHISHDVVINEHALIIANSTIAGHTVIGANSRVSPSSTILQRLVVGEKAHVGTGSVVNQNMPDRSVYVGNPAIEISKFAKLEREKRKSLKK